MPQLDNKTIKLIGSGQALPDSMKIRQVMAEMNHEPGSANKLPAIELRAVIDRPKRKNEAYAALTNTRVLNRNTSECYKSALNHVNPTERPRYNEPAFETPPEPDMNEFCFVAEEIAETFMKAKDAHLLMAEMVDQIENPDSHQTEDERAEMIADTRKVAQCVLDGNRYQAPMLKNFSRIKPNYGNAISKIGLMPMSHNAQPDSLNE